MALQIIRISQRTRDLQIVRRGAQQKAHGREPARDQGRIREFAHSQQDIDAGRVNILVGFAPVKPAEFVVLQLTQKAGQPAA